MARRRPNYGHLGSRGTRRSRESGSEGSEKIDVPSGPSGGGPMSRNENLAALAWSASSVRLPAMRPTSPAVRPEKDPEKPPIKDPPIKD